jgi:sirohydrochlorin ferrochelatase
MPPECFAVLFVFFRVFRGLSSPRSWLVADGLPASPRTAVLLIAHGSRHAKANADLDHVGAELRRRGRYGIVVASFLELAEPDIESGGARCAEQGAERVILLPYFLSAGIHVRRDLTEACRRLAERFPHVQFRLAEPLGRHPGLVDVVADRAEEAEREFDG